MSVAALLLKYGSGEDAAIGGPRAEPGRAAWPAGCPQRARPRAGNLCGGKAGASGQDRTPSEDPACTTLRTWPSAGQMASGQRRHGALRGLVCAWHAACAYALAEIPADAGEPPIKSSGTPVREYNNAIMISSCVLRGRSRSLGRRLGGGGPLTYRTSAFPHSLPLRPDSPPSRAEAEEETHASTTARTRPTRGGYRP
jgi:hypothetical protein